MFKCIAWDFVITLEDWLWIIVVRYSLCRYCRNKVKTVATILFFNIKGVLGDVIAWGAIKFNLPLYVAFVNYEKIFNKVIKINSGMEGWKGISLAHVQSVQLLCVRVYSI